MLVCVKDGEGRVLTEKIEMKTGLLRFCKIGREKQCRDLQPDKD